MVIKKPLIDYMKNNPYDELYTPAYAVKPLLKYIPKDKTIWCPFDSSNSEYVKIFRKNGYNIIYSHIKDGKDFLKYEPNEHYDIIISNPPFSIKTQVLERAYELNKPFCFLLPITTLEGVKRGKLFRRYGIQLIVFDRRINFIRNKKSVWFNTSYFCWKILPKDLIFESLKIS